MLWLCTNTHGDTTNLCQFSKDFSPLCWLFYKKIYNMELEIDEREVIYERKRKSTERR